MSDWTDISKELPRGKVKVLVCDVEGDFYVTHSDWIHCLADQPGIFAPGRYGRGIELTHWMKIPPLPEIGARQEGAPDE